MKELLRNNDLDIYWMQRALHLAKKAGQQGEVPVGALIIDHKLNRPLATGYNLRETLTTPLGHAEIFALHRAAKKLQSWRLTHCTLYVTLEPCLMCAGAILQARIPRIVFGAKDPKGGAVKSLYEVLDDNRFNHQAEVCEGILAKECGEILSQFFKQRRQEKKGF